MNLIISNRIIDTPISVILNQVKKELTNGKLRDIGEEVRNNIGVTCPNHKGGYEHKPSCYIFTKIDDNNIEYGKAHCFTCGWSASLPDFISKCFDEPKGFGEEWLLERFGSSYNSNTICLPRICLHKQPKSGKYLKEEDLQEYAYYHPYMWKRKLTKEVVDKFKIGYDPIRKAITFPVWDEKNNLVMVTSRSVNSKYFHIPKDIEKPVYLLNYVEKENISKVYVVESQINCLTLWSWGYPAIALFGTGSENQYAILNKSPIRNYILCFDGDSAGEKGIKRFLKNIRSDVFVSVKHIPLGKDVNDLDKSFFDTLPIS